MLPTRRRNFLPPSTGMRCENYEFSATVLADILFITLPSSCAECHGKVKVKCSRYRPGCGPEGG